MAIIHQFSDPPLLGTSNAEDDQAERTEYEDHQAEQRVLQPGADTRAVVGHGCTWAGSND